MTTITTVLGAPYKSGRLAPPDPRPATRRTPNTVRWWNDLQALKSMADFCDFNCANRYAQGLADRYYNIIGHGRRLPIWLKAAIINTSIEHGWTEERLQTR